MISGPSWQIDEAELADHADLLAAVLPLTAYQWFHNQKNMWIAGDQKKVFGKRPGKHAYDEPKLDGNTWGPLTRRSRPASRSGFDGMLPPK